MKIPVFITTAGKMMFYKTTDEGKKSVVVDGKRYSLTNGIHLTLPKGTYSCNYDSKLELFIIKGTCLGASVAVLSFYGNGHMFNEIKATNSAGETLVPADTVYYDIEAYERSLSIREFISDEYYNIYVDYCQQNGRTPKARRRRETYV